MQSSMRVALALLPLTFPIAACGDSTAPETVVGVYAMQSINGSAPPAVVGQDASGTLEVTGGQVSLNADQTFSDRTDFRFTDASTGAVTTTQDVATGTYTRSGNTVTLTPTGESPYSLTWDGSSLTQIVSGISIIYSK